MRTVKIISESSVAAGVRRIEGITGLELLRFLREKEELISETAHNLKTSPAEIAKRGEQIADELKAAKHEIESLNAKIASAKTADIMNNAVSVKGLRTASFKADGMAPDAVRQTIDNLKADNPDAVILIAAVNDGRANLVCGCGKDAVAAELTPARSSVPRHS